MKMLGTCYISVRLCLSTCGLAWLPRLLVRDRRSRSTLSIISSLKSPKAEQQPQCKHNVG